MRIRLQCALGHFWDKRDPFVLQKCTHVDKTFRDAFWETCFVLLVTFRDSVFFTLLQTEGLSLHLELPDDHVNIFEKSSVEFLNEHSTQIWSQTRTLNLGHPPFHVETMTFDHIRMSDSVVTWSTF